MIQKIKATDTIKDSRELINKNFKDLEDRIKKLEKLLKNNK
ncbi:MAG: hypothetical protein V1825_03140 [Candidatus Falkowbacteria bacterium]